MGYYITFYPNYFLCETSISIYNSLLGLTGSDNDSVTNIEILPSLAANYILCHSFWMYDICVNYSLMSFSTIALKFQCVWKLPRNQCATWWFRYLTRTELNVVLHRRDFGISVPDMTLPGCLLLLSEPCYNTDTKAWLTGSWSCGHFVSQIISTASILHKIDW